MGSVDAAVMPTNEDGVRLLALVREEIAGLGLTDTALVAALEGHVAAAVAASYPPERPPAEGPLALTDAEAGAVALAVMTGTVAATQAPASAPAPGPVAADLSTRDLIRLALRRRRRG